MMAAEAKHEQHSAPKTPDEQKAKEQKSKIKAAVKVACDELHAMRPQPRADEIDAVLAQIRGGAEGSAKDLYAKIHPAEAKAA